MADDRIPEPTNVGEYARLSPQQKWQLDQQRNPLNLLTDPNILLTRDAAGNVVVSKRS